MGIQPNGAIKKLHSYVIWLMVYFIRMNQKVNKLGTRAVWSSLALWFARRDEWRRHEYWGNPIWVPWNRVRQKRDKLIPPKVQSENLLGCVALSKNKVYIYIYIHIYLGKYSFYKTTNLGNPISLKVDFWDVKHCFMILATNEKIRVMSKPCVLGIFGSRKRNRANTYFLIFSYSFRGKYPLTMFFIILSGADTHFLICSEMTGTQNLTFFIFKLLLRPWDLSPRVERQKLMVNSRQEVFVRVQKRWSCG